MRFCPAGVTLVGLRRRVGAGRRQPLAVGPLPLGCRHVGDPARHQRSASLVPGRAAPAKLGGARSGRRGTGAAGAPNSEERTSLIEANPFLVEPTQHVVTGPRSGGHLHCNRFRPKARSDRLGAPIAQVRVRSAWFRPSPSGGGPVLVQTSRADDLGTALGGELGEPPPEDRNHAWPRRCLCCICLSFCRPVLHFCVLCRQRIPTCRRNEVCAGTLVAQTGFPLASPESARHKHIPKGAVFYR